LKREVEGPRVKTRNQKPETRNQKPETRNLNLLIAKKILAG
jgi:hypothetical protein